MERWTHGESAVRLHEEMRAARAHTDTLFALIADETLYERPVPDRHRLIFYVGHVDAFDWNQLGRGVLDLPPFHSTFDRLFEAGIDPPPGQAAVDSAGACAAVAGAGCGDVRPVRRSSTAVPTLFQKPRQGRGTMEPRCRGGAVTALG